MPSPKLAVGIADRLVRLGQSDWFGPGLLVLARTRLFQRKTTAAITLFARVSSTQARDHTHTNSNLSNLPRETHTHIFSFTFFTFFYACTQFLVQTKRLHGHSPHSPQHELEPVLYVLPGRAPAHRKASLLNTARVNAYDSGRNCCQQVAGGCDPAMARSGSQSRIPHPGMLLPLSSPFRFSVSSIAWSLRERSDSFSWIAVQAGTTRSP